MTDQQANLLKLFKEIDAICKKNNIKYCLAGGTAIGAVRHHGFIPWDDDMDLYMTRDNWLKFVEASKTDFPEGRCLLCHELDHSFTNMFGRYCDATVTAIHKHSIYQKEVAGEVIDILTLDPVPNDSKTYARYTDNIMLYSELINTTAPAYGYRFYVNSGRYLRYWLLSKLIGRKHVLNILEKKLFSYKEEDCDYYAMRWGGAPFLFPKEWFMGDRTCQFEDGEYYIPYMNNAYLTWHYGDNWVYIPSHAERESHNTVSRLDMGSDDFRKEYNKFVKSGKRRWYIELLGTYRKAYHMRVAHRKEKVFMAMLNDKAKLISMELNARIAADGNDMLNLSYEHKFKELGKIYDNYIKNQLSRDFIGREDFPGMRRFNDPCFVPIEDRNLHAALYMYLYTNKVAQAERMLNIRKKQENFNEQEFEDIYSFIKRFRHSTNCYDLQKYEEGYKEAKALLQEYPDNPLLLKLLIRFTFYKNAGDTETAKEYVRKAVELYKEDGEFLYYNVMFVDKITDKDKLAEAFLKIKTMTSNGIILLEIEEYR